MEKKIVATAIAWYTEENYQTIKEQLPDGHLLSPTYDQWHSRAQQVEKQITDAGQIAIRAPINDIEELRQWCNARGLDIDAEGRTAFANFIAIKKYRNMN